MPRLPLALLFILISACDGAEAPAPSDAGASADAHVPSDASADAGLTDLGALADAGEVAEAGLPPDAGEVDGGGSDAGGGDAGAPDAAPVDAGPAPAVPDPEAMGPYATERFEETFRVAASRNRLPLDCYLPSNGPGPFPLVLIGHGFQIAARQYTGYATHLASFGFVACTADFAAGIIANHAENAEDVIAGVDHLLGLSADSGNPLSGKIDPSRIGLTGHSLGGKVAFLGAARDSRIGAVFGIDPVDTSMLCSATRCPDASDLLPLTIPVGVIGETLDGAGNRACAPAADNFQTFYEAASSPAVEIDALGASHTSFVDDPSTCGLACSVCNAPTASQSDVLRLTRAMVAAFFLRHLTNESAYDLYLTGVIAQSRYVQPGQASIRFK